MNTTPEQRADLLKSLEVACECWHTGAPANDIVKLCETFVPELLADLEEAQARLQSIAEYWDRDENEVAMSDALWHIIEVAESTETSCLEAARREGEDRVIDKLLAAQANENAARSMCEDLRRQLAEAQAHKFFCLTELKRANDLALSECGMGIVDQRIFGLDESKALDAVIEETVNSEKKNPWKASIINALIVNHIYTGRHDSEPIKAIADLIDWECKVALDPTVSSEKWRVEAISAHFPD